MINDKILRKAYDVYVKQHNEKGTIHFCFENFVTYSNKTFIKSFIDKVLNVERKKKLNILK